LTLRPPRIALGEHDVGELIGDGCFPAPAERRNASASNARLTFMNGGLILSHKLRTAFGDWEGWCPDRSPASSPRDQGSLAETANKLNLRTGTRRHSSGVLLAWTVIWLGWNTLAPNGLRFDPYPAFVLWLFLSNLIQICLMPLIMVGQNLQGRHAEARAQADFEINKKAEREIEAILQHLERQSDLSLRILNHLERNQ
jgi:Protein of unknown function (DUF1003)